MRHFACVSFFTLIHALLLGGALFEKTAHADDELLSVRILPPERLQAGDHTEVVVEVTAPRSQRRPLILTPTSEGDAIEVVRGRFLRSDASEEGNVLRFRVPIVATSPGSAVLRVRVTSYVCSDNCVSESDRCIDRCRSVDGDAFVVVRVVP